MDPNLIYIFCAALGSVLVGASLLVGDADTDLDADFDADLDFDADGGDFDLSVIPFASMRFWTFLVTTFGFSGLTFSFLGLSPVWVLGISLALGGLIGYGGFQLFRYLSREQVSAATDLAHFRDTEARVLIRVPENGRGKIVIDSVSGRVEMMAHTRDGNEIPKDAIVLVVGTKDGVAEVTHLDNPSKTTSEVARNSIANSRPLTERNL